MQNISISLRPLGMGELLDQAIRLYRRNFLRFVGVLAIMQIPLAGINLIINLSTYDLTLNALPSATDITGNENPFAILGPEYYSTVFINAVVTITYLILVSGIASAALTKLASDDYLGLPPSSNSVFEAYADIGDRWQTLVKSIFLYLIFVVVGLVWTIIPCIGWFTGPGLLLAMAGMVLPLVAPVVVLENHGARDSIRRAWELVRGRFWWIFGFMVLLYLFNWVVVGGPSLLTGMMLSFIIPEQLASNDPQMLYNIQVSIQEFVNLIFNSLYLPLQLTCLTLLYYDLRVRQEGLDLSLSASNQLQKEAVLEQIANTGKVSERPIIARNEISYFATLSGGVLGLYLLLVFVISFIILAFAGG